MSQGEGGKRKGGDKRRSLKNTNVCLNTQLSSFQGIEGDRIRPVRVVMNVWFLMLKEGTVGKAELIRVSSVNQNRCIN